MREQKAGAVGPRGAESHSAATEVEWALSMPAESSAWEGKRDRWSPPALMARLAVLGSLASQALPVGQPALRQLEAEYDRLVDAPQGRPSLSERLEEWFCFVGALKAGSR